MALDPAAQVLAMAALGKGGKGGGSYNDLTDLPKINGKEVKGNLSSDDLNIDYASGKGITVDNEGRTISLSPDFSDLKKVSETNDYLYEITYRGADYDYAFKEFKKDDPLINMPGMCSSVRSGGFFGRNFDWTYNEEVTFVTHVIKDGINVLYNSTNVASGLSDLEADFVRRGEYSQQYKLVPFKARDGINEEGVFVTVNVVPTDLGFSAHIEAEVDEEVELNATMIPRYVLDHFDNAEDAVNYLRDYCTIFIPRSDQEIGYELHFMIGDSTETYLVEFISDAIEITKMNTGKEFMTNFYLHGVTFNADGSVYTPATQDSTHNAQTTNKITAHGAGLERFNIINTAVRAGTTGTKIGMSNLMDSLKYTQTYTKSGNNSWYTEYVGEYNGVNYTVSTAPAVFDAEGGMVEVVKNAYAHKTRDSRSPYYGTWHTMHSSVYDIDKKILYIKSQEKTTEFTFEIISGDTGGVWGQITGDIDDQTDLAGKFTEVHTEINNLKNIGRFCAIWDASAGSPTSEPIVTPYIYKTGDYFRIGVAGYKVPTGSQYNPGEYDLVEEETGIGDVWYYDGVEWVKQASSGGGTVQDVQVNGTSVLSGGIANIPPAGNNLGVVKTTLNGSGGLSINDTGSMYIVPSTSAEIEAKTQVSKPIVPSNIDKAVMEGLGNNDLTWTDAYKANARTTIGASPVLQFVKLDEEG